MMGVRCIEDDAEQVETRMKEIEWRLESMCVMNTRQSRTEQKEQEERGMDSSVLKDYICFQVLVKQRVLSSSPCR
jgi:hypothetical protein